MDVQVVKRLAFRIDPDMRVHSGTRRALSLGRGTFSRGSQGLGGNVHRASSRKSDLEHQDEAVT